MQRIRELAGKVLPGVFPPEPVVDVLALARDGEVSLAAMGLKLDEGPLDTDGNNALLVACANGHTALVRALLASNASINVTNGEGCNSLHVAAAQDRHEVVQALLELDRDKVTTLTTATCGAGLWQTLHVAASSGAAQTTSLLLSKSGVSDIDGRDMAGNTALVIACCNGHTAVALDLLEHGADATVRNLKGESCLYLAARNGRQDIVERLLCLGKEERDVLIHTAESHGRTPLYVACGAGRVAVVNTLIAAKADVQTKSSDGTSLVHIASRAQGGAEVIGVLLRHGAPVVSLNSFGSTCLHEAGLAGKAETVKAVLAAPEASEMLSMQDFDGLAPLFSACNALRNPSVQGEDAVAAVSAMLDARADPNALDYTGAPPLLHVAWRPERPETLTVARLLLEARANPTLEYEQGWSALHVACNKHSGDATQGEQTEAMRELLYRACEEGHPEYLETFDQEKRRDKEANALYRSQAGPAMRIPIEQRRAVLPNGANVESIAQRLVDSHSVVVLSGAGISVSAGIPDFRSPGEGMYAREDTRRAFDAGFVLEQPDKFYAMLKDTFLPSRYGGPRPTLTHAFIKLLSDKKALRRHITQNIDGLDVAAGVPSDLVVEAHGSFAAARCANASCSKPADDMHAFWTTVKDGGVPRCDACASPLRPNVTFFGEALPERYGDLADSDAHNADLLIVLGTSLVVYPFASLVNTVGLLTPRSLINRKPVGPFRDAVGTGMEQGNYRDVAYLGDCDDGVRKLAQLCGWEAQLDEEYKQMLTRLDAEA